jgi:hypothetical protein
MPEAAVIEKVKEPTTTSQDNLSQVELAAMVLSKRIAAIALEAPNRDAYASALLSALNVLTNPLNFHPGLLIEIPPEVLAADEDCRKLFLLTIGEMATMIERRDEQPEAESERPRHEEERPYAHAEPTEGTIEEPRFSPVPFTMPHTLTEYAHALRFLSQMPEEFLKSDRWVRAVYTILRALADAFDHSPPVNRD